MAYLYDLTDTWNAAGTVFNAIKMNVTNSASAAGSKIVSLQVGSTDRFTVDKDGNGYFSGTLQAVGAISFPNAYLSGNSGTIGMQDNTASILAYNGTGSGGITNTLRFITGASERMRIDGSGNIGIGTASPGAKLDVNGQSNFRSAINMLTGSQAYFYNPAGNAYGYVAMDSSNILQLMNVAGSALTLGTSNSERMRIDSSGNIGIGTSSPGVKLDVIGVVRSTGFSATGTTAYQPQTTMTNWSAGATGGYYIFYKGRAGGTTSQSGDTLGTMLWYGYDSANASTAAASIFTVQTAAAGAGSVPSALVFANGGNAERMRIDSSGNIGIGTASPATKLNVIGDIQLSRSATASDAAINFGSNANNYIYSGNSSNIMAFATNGSERMRIDNSGNVGIGTSSPARTFSVLSSSTVPVRIESTTTDTVIELLNSGTTSTTRPSIGSYNTNMVFNTNGSERARIDSSGNFQLGTTGVSTRLAIGVNTDQADGIRIDNANNSARMSVTAVGSNGYGISGWANSGLIEAVPASTGGLVLSAYTGNMMFQTNGRTEAMRINSSGNVGIGTSSPSQKLTVQGAQLTIPAAGWSAGQTAYSYLGDTNGGISATNGGNVKVFAYNGVDIVTNGVTPATVLTATAGGNVGIGTSSPSFKLDVQGNSSSTATVARVYNGNTSASSNAVFNCSTGQGVSAEWYSYSSANWFGTKSNHPQLFITNNSERMRIDSSGNLLVGTSSVNGTGWTVNPNGSGQIRSTGTGSEDKIQFANGNGVVGAITTNGTATAYNTSSDYRLKDIDGPVQNSGAYIDALKPVQGKWKTDGSRFIGLIAHEVQEVSETQIATGVKDGDEMQAMDYSAPELIANLIAEIQSLRARVAQLEGN